MGGLLQEDRERARRGFAAMARHATDAPDAPPSPSHGLHALLAAVEDEPGAAQVRADVRRCGATTAPYNALLVGYAEAVAAGRCGRTDDAERLLVDAEQALPADATGRPVEVLQHLGRRLVAERAVLDGWGEPAAWLRAAAAGLDDDAPQVAAACRRLLRAAGEKAPRRVVQPLPEAARRAGVTLREHEVLLLVAAGATNAAVAAQLHLSPRTVETHVARLLQKTGVARRGLLTSWLSTAAAEGR
jgi:DNA-binding CsgD family transcriptional regulator